MAFMTVQTGGNGGDGGGDRLPVLSYNAKAGRLFLLDRTQAADGTWSSNKRDVTMEQPAFAVDFGSLEIGYLFFPAGAAPIMVMAPYGQPMPTKPASPGNDDKGKPLQFKQGFRVKVIGKAIGGVRELAGNAGTSIEGLNQLHNDYEAAPEAAAGMIPLVKMTNVMPIKAGQSENFMPIYTIQQWVERPAALGPRTVPPPSAGARTAQPQPQQQSNHVPPPPPKEEAPKQREPELAEADMPF
jgi:hypothetical protein